VNTTNIPAASTFSAVGPLASVTARTNRDDDVSTPIPTERPSFDRAFTVPEAAQILGVSQDTLRRLLKARAIEHLRISTRKTMIRDSAIRRYLASVTIDAKL
jgi:excisionase family DNA binding protein